VNCPKCGFAQEERIDCRKCGVVFAKYYALHAADPAAPADSAETAVPGRVRTEEPAMYESPELIEIRQELQILQQRFKDFEFERAERKRLQNELRALDEGVRAAIDQIVDRQDGIEQIIAELAATQPGNLQQEVDDLRLELGVIDIKSIHTRMEWVESQLHLNAAEICTRSDLEPLDRLPAIEARLSAAEQRLAGVAQERAAVPENGADDRVEAACKAIEEMRSSLQAVSLRYTEIGELKKNHLVLRNLCESMQHALEAARKEPANGNAAKILEVLNEMSALRAEARQVCERLDALEICPPSHSAAADSASREELASLRSELFTAAGHVVEESERTQSGLSTLERRLADLATEISDLRQQFMEACASMPEYQPQPEGKEPDRPAADPPAHADMLGIRENLVEIRRFMETLSLKL